MRQIDDGQSCALITEKRRVLDPRKGTPAVWLRTEAIAIEFRCAGTSRDGGSGSTDRESGICRMDFLPDRSC